jgi:hypothetical protein
MNNLPWITFEAGSDSNVLTHYEPTSDLLENNERPSFCTFVGKRSKAVLLDELLGGLSCVPVHKEVYLWTSHQLRHGQHPLLIIDSGIQAAHPPDTSLESQAARATSWPIQRSTSDLNTQLCGSIFAPFSSLIVCFVSDLGGPKAVAQWLAAQIIHPVEDTTALPRILLVVETSSESFDQSIAASKAIALLLETLANLKPYDQHTEIQQDIDRRFRNIEVIGLHSSRSIPSRARALRRRLLAMSKASMIERISKRVDFSFSHFKTLSKQALGHMCNEDSSELFMFTKASRPNGFSADLLAHCLSDFLTLLPSQAWLWHFAAPILASALLLSSYPPYAHGKLYSPGCLPTINDQFFPPTPSSEPSLRLPA